MEESKRLPTIAQVAFLAHLVVAVALGVLFVVQPTRSLGWFNFTVPPDMKPVVRALGLIIGALGGVTSLYGFMAPKWEYVKYIVHAEISYLGLQAIMFFVSLGISSGPVLGDAVFGAISAVLAALFIAAFLNRPK
jgi:hypothetical protein